MARLIQGELKIKKLPWVPSPLEEYWTLDVVSEDGVKKMHNTGHVDEIVIQRGLAFRTKEEAIAKAREMGIVKEDE